ncbi:MAG: HDOD domain-containing protein [Fibrobacterota bacterium]|nr:HDOD domain-containing protein [Fibrobacterota bacterium]QQS04386.1 MAG: HDOD domain-containing protein [Fibrobacterota bacterium]
MIAAMSTTPAKTDPVELILKEGAQLPSLPEVLLKLDRELASEDADLQKIAKLVGMDPVLSGQILRLANSTWYNPGGKPIQDLSRALVRLGIPTTRELVHALVIPALFPKGGSAIDLTKFWRHSFAVALFAQAIGKRLHLDRKEMEVLWTAGLLHDIGVLVFDLLSKENFRRILKLCQEDPFAEPDAEMVGVDLLALEREWLGSDHASLGSVFLQKYWKLPDPIIWCVRYHLELGWALEEPDAIKSILPIHVANTLCEERGETWVPLRARRSSHLGEAWKKMGFSEKDAEEMAAEVDVALEKSDQLLAASG